MRKKGETHEILKALSDGRRRTVLRVLQERSVPVADEEVATVVVATEQAKRLLEVTEPEMETVLCDLRTSQFPVLENADLINWDKSADTVALTTHPTLHNSTFTRILETDILGWDTVLASLAHERRRTALAVLATHDNPLSKVALAREIASHETDDGTRPDPDRVDELCLTLHHIHLPHLADAGLIEYDAHSGAVSYRGHPLLEDEDWFDLYLTDPPRTMLSVAEPSQDIWRLEGR